MKLRDNGGNIFITIPRDVTRHYRMLVGSEFDLLCDDRKIIIDLTTAERSKLFDPPAKALEPESVA